MSEYINGYVTAVLELRGEFEGNKKPVIKIKHKTKEVLQYCVDVMGGYINGPYKVGKYSKSLLYVYTLKGADLDKSHGWIFKNIDEDIIKDWRERHNDYFLKAKVKIELKLIFK